MSATPEFSILMPVSAQRAYLADAVASVLGQSLDDLELIVIDDAGDADECRRLSGESEDPRVRVLSNHWSRGGADALNCGLDASHGRVICICDADDLFPPDHLQRCADLLARQSEFDAVAGGLETLTSRGASIAWLHRDAVAGEITAELRRGVTRTSLCTFAVRREAMLATTPFRPYFLTSYDIDFQLRLGERFRVWFDPAIAYHWRLHDQSVTHTQAGHEREFFEDAARAFQKQRLERGDDDLQRGQPPRPPVHGGPATSLIAAQQTQQMLLGAAWRQHQDGYKAQAIGLGWRACLAHPWRLSAWKSLAALAVKKSPATAPQRRSS